MKQFDSPTFWDRPDSPRVGPYRVEGPLGRGGMGEVVAAYDERLDRRVAIKRIRHDRAARLAASGRERLRREARAVAGLSHPAIVQIHDILSDGDDDAIVMELVEGRSVAESLVEGPLPLVEALRLARQVAEGLAEAHRAGLVHRDLKAENVMVTPPRGAHPGRAKILDFGLAKRLSKSELDASLTREGEVLGTVRAMSPEQARGQEVDHRTDLFALGVLLYEMVAGRSPFAGANPVDTLRRVIYAPARPLREHRPDAPAELERLIARLLEKRPEDRPQGADEVARALAELESLVPDEPAPPPRSAESLGNAPTGSLPVTPTAVAPAPADDPTPPARRRQVLRPATIVLVLALGALAAAAVLFLRGRAPADPVRVAVLRPQVEAPGARGELALVASGVLEAGLRATRWLEGLEPVDPHYLGAAADTPAAVARAVAADEVLSATVAGRGALAEVSLRRIRGSDGRVLWNEAFEVSTDPREARLVAEAVAVRLRRAYPRHPPRRDAPALEVHDEDYAEYLRVVGRINAGAVDLRPELERLEAILRTSPRFLEAHVTAAAAALNHYTDVKDVDLLDRAERWTDAAAEIAPQDPRPLELRVRLALERGRPAEAEAALAELERLSPGSLEVLVNRSRLAERSGELARAVELMRRAVERRPDWRNLYRLARLETRRGEVATARAHFAELLRRVPGHRKARSALAAMELSIGDLERAEELYAGLVEDEPHRSELTNLGTARFFLGRVEEAAESYRAALALEPDHPIVLVSLADAESALGRKGEAEALYRRTLDVLERRRAVSSLSAQERMIEAQCRARLGQAQRAIEITLATLQRNPEDAEIAYMAAVVYALVGERASALASAKNALAMGFEPRWFAIPELAELQEDESFRRALESRLHG